MAFSLEVPQGRERDRSVHDVEQAKKTILIYSPDLNFCFSLSMLFQDRYNVVTTTNLAMLDSFAEHYDADLVIVDALPSEKMIQKVDGLKMLHPDLPVILLYVYGPKEMSLDKTVRGHVDYVFYKPLDVALVARRIDEMLLK